MKRRRPKPRPQAKPDRLRQLLESVTPNQPRRPLKKAVRTSTLLRATQAAEELGLPYTTIRQLARQGEFPVVMIGVRWYLRRMDLEAFISRQLRQFAAS